MFFDPLKHLKFWATKENKVRWKQFIEIAIFASVKRVFSILFLSTYLLANTQLSEVLKFPLLVEHFITHHEESGMSVWGFMEHHYFTETIKYADHETDMKLPFKTISNSINNSIAIAPTPLFNSNKTFYNYPEKKTMYSLYGFNYTSPHLNSIWQPPKFC